MEKQIYHLFVQGSIGIETQTDHVGFSDITLSVHLFPIEELPLAQWNHRF